MGGTQNARTAIHRKAHIPILGTPSIRGFMRMGGTTLPRPYDDFMPSDLKRYQSEGSYHFITFSCYHRLPYLDNDQARTIFEEQFERLRDRHQFCVIGYVLMPEHVHLLISEPKRYKLATTLNVLKSETSNRLKGDRQQFWQTRYYDFNVLTQAKLVEKLRYIHRNPVERGLVPSPEDWPWSSFRHWLTGETSRVEIHSGWKLQRANHPTS